MGIRSVKLRHITFATVVASFLLWAISATCFAQVHFGSLHGTVNVGTDATPGRLHMDASIRTFTARLGIAPLVHFTRRWRFS